MSCVYGCLPGNYNWNIIFRGNDRSIELELRDVSRALDGTYRLNPQCPSVQQWSGGGDPYWPQRREEIITQQKCDMIKEALRNGVSRWIDNAIKYIETKDITNEYKQQFPQMYNYLTDKNSIPYEIMVDIIHYKIVETIQTCEKSKEVTEKYKTFEDKQKELAKKWIEKYKKMDYDYNRLFLEIEKSHMKSKELYQEYITLKNLKRDYNKNNYLYDILYDNNEISLRSNAERIIRMRNTNELKFLQYFTLEKVLYIVNLIKNPIKKNPICIGENIEIEFFETETLH